MAPRYFQNPNLLNYLQTNSNSGSFQSVSDLYEYNNIIKNVKDTELYHDLAEPFHGLLVTDGVLHQPRSNWDMIEISENATRSWENGDSNFFDITAIGGWDNDWIRGNDYDNILIGDDRDQSTMYEDGGVTPTYDGTTDRNHYVSFGDDALYGLGGNDQLFGNAGCDYLDGGSGDDILYGGGNNDILVGGSGYDKLYGGHGKDILIGGNGGAVFYGGSGEDVFRLEMDSLSDHNAVMDCKDKGDKVEFQFLDGNQPYSAELYDVNEGQVFHMQSRGASAFVTLHSGNHYHFDQESMTIEVMGANGIDQPTISS